MANSTQEGYINKLKNRLFSCLCAREEGKDWVAGLDNILIELLGIPEDDRGISYYIIFYKLSSCRYLEYSYFRKTIFDCINCLNFLVGDKNGL